MNEKLMQMLYQFEHNLLPRFFFDEDINLVKDAHDNPEIIFMLFDDLCKNQEVEHPYTVKDFKCGFFTMDPDEKWLSMVIRFPEPVQTPLCYDIYFFFDRDFSKKGCYTLEYNTKVRKHSQKTATPDGKIQEHTTLKQEPCGFLCSWTKDHTHVNYGSDFLDKGIDFCSEALRIHQKNFE